MALWRMKSEWGKMAAIENMDIRLQPIFERVYVYVLCGFVTKRNVRAQLLSPSMLIFPNFVFELPGVMCRSVFACAWVLCVFVV